MPQEEKKVIIRNERGQKIGTKGGGSKGGVSETGFGYVPKGKEGDSRYKGVGISSEGTGTGMDPRNRDPLNDEHVKEFYRQNTRK